MTVKIAAMENARLEETENAGQVESE